MKQRESSHRPQSPTGMEGLHTMRCGLDTQGYLLRHCSFYPSAMQPCRPEPGQPACVVATLYRETPPHVFPHPTWPSVRIASMWHVTPLHTCYHHHLTLRCGRGAGILGAWFSLGCLWHKSRKLYIVNKWNLKSFACWASVNFVIRTVHFISFHVLNQQNERLKYNKTDRKILATLGANAYMFRNCLPIRKSFVLKNVIHNF